MQIEDAIKRLQDELKLTPRGTHAHNHLKGNLDKLKAGTHENAWMLGASLDAAIPPQMVPTIKVGLVVSEHHRKIADKLRREFGNAAVTDAHMRLVGYECRKAAVQTSRKSDIQLVKQSGLGFSHEWVAEGACTEICERLNGQQQPVGQPFVDPGTAREIEFPPLSIECNCRLKTVSSRSKYVSEPLDAKQKRIQEKLNRL